MPCLIKVSARPADGRPAANRRCTESSARMVCGGVSGIESRTPHGPTSRTCSGSSWLLPQVWVANGAPGATSTRPGVGPPPLWSRSQAAASRQYCGSAVNVPGGVSRPVQASEVETISAVRTTRATAADLWCSGWTNARRHTGAGALPGSGMRPSRWVSPKTTGIRSTDSSLCRLRSGAPAPSRKVCTAWASGEPSPPA